MKNVGPHRVERDTLMETKPNNTDADTKPMSQFLLSPIFHQESPNIFRCAIPFHLLCVVFTHKQASVDDFEVDDIVSGDIAHARHTNITHTVMLHCMSCHYSHANLQCLSTLECNMKST